jgi:hypothetical protein
MFGMKHPELCIPFRLDSRPPDLVFVAIPLDFVPGGFGFRRLDLENASGQAVTPEPLPDFDDVARPEAAML